MWPGQREFTAAQVNALLERSGAHPPGAALDDVVAEPLGVGESMMSDLLRLRLVGARGGAPASLVVKVGCADPYRRGIADRFGFYRREAAFYAGLAEHVDVRVPRCYASAFDPAGTDVTLVLEDLTACSSIQQADGCGWAEADAAVGALARLHAPWWGRTDELPMRVGTIDSAAYLDKLVATFTTSWPRCRQLAGDRLSAEILAVGDAWTELAPQLASRIAAPATLCHGDFRLDNLRFDDAGVVVFDWQLVTLAHGVSDLAYFASQSMRTAARTGRDRELVDRYGDALAARGVEIDRAHAWTVYRASVLAMLIFPVALYGGYDELDELGQRTAAAMLDRAVAAITELRACQTLT